MVNLLRYYSDGEGPGDYGSRVFIGEEGDVVRYKGSGNNISVVVETSLLDLLEDFRAWGLFLSCRSTQIFAGSVFRLKEFNCKWRLKNEYHKQTSQ